MRAEICPEHRVSEKNYKVFLTVNEKDRSIVDLKCKDCAAALGNNIITIHYYKIKLIIDNKFSLFLL